MHAGEEDHARPGWTTSIRGQDSPWKSQSERQRTEINRKSTSVMWPTIGSRTAKEQNRNVSGICSSTKEHNTTAYLFGYLCSNGGFSW